MSFFSSTPTDLDGPLEYGITGDAMHIILRGGMLNSLIIKSPPGHPHSPCMFRPGYPHSSCKSPPGYAHSPCKSTPGHPHLLCKKFSPVNKNLIQFNNKDCGTMIIDITLECFYWWLETGMCHYQQHYLINYFSGKEILDQTCFHLVI